MKPGYGVAGRKLLAAGAIIAIGHLAGAFDTDGFIPRAHCLQFEWPTLAARIIGDGLTALAYFSIPHSIRQFRRAHDVHLIPPHTLVAFEVFILLCGADHLSDIIVVWYPWYRFDAALRVCTGLVSAAVAIGLAVEVPRLLAYVNNLVTERDDLEARLYDLQERTEGGSS